MIDAGMGTSSLYEFVRRNVLKNKDVDIEIAATHDHFDHVSGLSRFVGTPQLKTVYVHEEDAAPVGQILKGEASKVRSVADGDEIPLGGRSVKAIHVSGHTFVSVAYWYEDNLYTGDAVGTGDVWLGFTPISIEEHIGSLRHLLDRIADRKLAVLGGHTGECRAPPSASSTCTSCSPAPGASWTARSPEPPTGGRWADWPRSGTPRPSVGRPSSTT